MMKTRRNCHRGRRPAVSRSLPALSGAFAHVRGLAGFAVAVVVVVVGRVVVVVVSRGAVVDVVPPPHPPPVHASQQLGCVPTQALPPFGAVHASAPFTTLHVVVPLASVRQQVTAPGFPHVELDAQFMTVLAQSSGSVPDFTAAFVAWATQLT